MKKRYQHFPNGDKNNEIIEIKNNGKTRYKRGNYSNFLNRNNRTKQTSFCIDKNYDMIKINNEVLNYLQIIINKFKIGFTESIINNYCRLFCTGIIFEFFDINYFDNFKERDENKKNRILYNS